MSREPAGERWATADAALRGVLSEAGAARWWITPIPALGNRAPIVVWEAGNETAVRRVITDYLEPSFS